MTSPIPIAPLVRTDAEPLLATIGNTPLIRLEKIPREFPGIEIFGKAEYFNPGGSVKDRAARSMVLINDLIRNPVHYAVSLAGRAIYRSRVTRHDAPASVRAAYTVDEVRSILKQSGVPAVWVRTFYFYRMGVIAWKKAESSTT